MKKIAIALTALGLFAAPALADTVKHDGPYSGFSSNQTVTPTSGGDFGASITAGGKSDRLITVGEDINR